MIAATRATTAIICVSLFSWIAVGCVPHVSVNDAPCPCGDGFHCCPTLSACLRDERACPQGYPPSTERGCSSDDDCPRGELCASWTTVGSTGPSEEVSGPQHCRKDCKDGYVCGEDETCAFSLHDAGKTDALDLVRLCLPTGDGCDAWRCNGCPNSDIGETQCHEHQIIGCLVGVHPSCGISCREVVLQSGCDGLIPPRQCPIFPCSDCLEDTGGRPVCSGDDVSVCFIGRPYEPEICDVYCIQAPVETCANGCQESELGAYCAE
ncbi:hypothetical protein ACFL6C_00555 [Myxococcota bacterium]